MIEVLSLVNFDNQERVEYLHKSFGSFYNYNTVDRHVVIDSSTVIGKQKEIYEKYGIEYYHKPISYSQRLKFGVSILNADYFLYLPDDYEWIFDFAVEETMIQAKKHNIKEIKLVCPSMQWFSKLNPDIKEWYNEDFVLQDVQVLTKEGNKLKRLFWDIHTFITKNERLIKKDDLYISNRHFRRSFQQQFSLGCHILERNFVKKLSLNMPDYLLSPSEVEKNVYKQLIFKKYLTAYYNMETPAFHFVDLNIEGLDKKHFASMNLIKENFKYFVNMENKTI